MTFKASGIITLTTDFGLSDPYVGVMKGVLLGRHPAAQVIDLTHQIPAFQPALAGFWLARVWPYFAAGTVHLAVVDPGVGTARGMVLLHAHKQVFIAPDNGLLEPVLHSGTPGEWRVFSREDLHHLQLPTPSHTFHGRDIFAPLVAEISANRQQPTALGRRVERTHFPAPLPPGHGRIICADHYGNLLTDIDAKYLKTLNTPVVLLRGHLVPLRQSYGFAPPGELLALINSWGTLEIAIAQGSAQQHLQAAPGEPVQVVEASAPRAPGP